MRWPSWQEKKAIFSLLDYVPTEAQEPIHKSTADILLVGGGERGGKSCTAAMEAVARLPWCAAYAPGHPVFLVGEKYDRCVPEFDYISGALLRLGDIKPEDISRPADGQQRCIINALGTRIMTISAQKGIAQVRGTGQAPVLVVMCEAGYQSYGVFLACVGRVAEARGAVIASGSFPDDTGWYAQRHKAYQGPNEDGGESFTMPTWSNTVVYPGGEQDPEILKLKARYPRLDFLRFVGADPQPPATLVFPEFRYSTHVKESVVFDDNEPVWVAVDPGYRGAYAVVAVQIVGPQVTGIDEVYRWGAEHGEEAYGERVIEECMRSPWWENVTDGVIDIAGLQHHAALSQREIWSAKTAGRLPARPGDALSLKWRTVPEFAGLQRMRTFLCDPATGEPMLLLSPECEHTAREFGLYRYREVKEGMRGSESPIDAHNHSIKALIYLLYYLYGPVEWQMGEIPKRVDRWHGIYGRKEARQIARRYGE